MQARISNLILAAAVSVSVGVAPLPVLAATGGTAPAIDPDAKARAQGLYQQGATAYRLGKFDKAVANFEAAYAEVPLPTFLYNIGLSYKRLFETTDDLEAAKSGRAVLQNFKIEIQKDPDLGDEDEIDTLIAEIAARSAEVKAENDKKSERERQEALEHARASQNQNVAVDRGPDPGRGLRIGGYSAIGAGGAVLVTGVITTAVFAARAGEASDQAQSSSDACQTNPDGEACGNLDFWRNEGRKADRNSVIGGVIIGIGGLVAIAGIPMLIIGSRRTKAWRAGAGPAPKGPDEAEEPSVSLLPYWGPGQGGLSLTGRF